MSSPDREFMDAACRLCGCAEDRPCEGGCAWVYDPGWSDLCSRCLDRVFAALATTLPKMKATLGVTSLSQAGEDLDFLERFVDAPGVLVLPASDRVGPVARVALQERTP